MTHTSLLLGVYCFAYYLIAGIGINLGYHREQETTMTDSTEALGFIDPTAGTGRKRVPLAPRPADLAGKVVGLLDNTKEQGTLILETIGNALREQYGVASVVLLRKEHYSKPATDALIDQMAKEVDVAVAALGG